MTNLTNWNQRRYLLDTNIFINAYNHYYAFDICPGFWECLEHHCRAGQVMSIDRVKEELEKPPELVSWARRAPDGMFLSSREEPIINIFNSVMSWVEESEIFTDEAKRKFAKGADGWLVAYAKCYEAVVVTHEAYRPEAKSRVMIPNVCRQFKIECMTTYEMLRELGVQFDWGGN